MLAAQLDTSQGKNTMSEMSYPAIPDPEGVERVYGELLARAPENKMAPRLDAAEPSKSLGMCTAPPRLFTSPELTVKPVPPA